MKRFKLTLLLLQITLISLATSASIKSASAPRGKRDAQLHQLLSEVLSENSNDELLSELSPSELLVACSESAAYEDYDIETCESDICCKQFFIGNANANANSQRQQNVETFALTSDQSKQTINTTPKMTATTFIRQPQEPQHSVTHSESQASGAKVQGTTNVTPREVVSTTINYPNTKTNYTPQPRNREPLNRTQNIANYPTNQNASAKRADVPSKPVIIIEGPTEKSMPTKATGKLYYTWKTVSQNDTKQTSTASVTSGTTTEWMTTIPTTLGGALTEITQRTTQRINALATTTTAAATTSQASTESNTQGTATTTKAKVNDSEVLDTKLCQEYTKPDEDDYQYSQNFEPQLRHVKKKKKLKKTYMEPIGYETKLMRPTRRMLLPQNQNLFLDDRQIFQVPQSTYKVREPPSIYLNNIVSGLNCGDRTNRSRRPCLAYGNFARPMAATTERPSNYRYDDNQERRRGFDYAQPKYSAEQSSEFITDSKESSDCTSSMQRSLCIT